MGGSALGDSLSPRWHGAQSRRGIIVAGLVIGVLLATALVSRRHGPGWVASRTYRTRAAAAADALHEDFAEDVASGRAAQRHIEAREALQQAAGDVGDDSGGGIGGSSDGGGGGVSTGDGGVSTGGGGGGGSPDVPKRTHRRSSKASSAAVTQTAGGGTADPADLAWQPATAQAGSGASPVDAADGAADGSSADDGERAEAAAGDGAASGTEADGSREDAGEADASEADGSSDDGEAGDAAPAEPAGKGGGSSGGGDGKDQASAAEADGDSGDGGSSAEAQKAAAERQDHTPDQAAADEPGAEAIDRAVGATDDGNSAENGSGEREKPGSKGRQRQAHKWGRRRASRGPIQAELLAAVEAAANDDGAVMLAVTNRDGALFQLPQLLSSLKLVPQEDASRHLVVVCYSAPGQAACRRQHAHCVLDSYETGGLGTGNVGNVDGFAGWGSKQFKGITWRKIQLVQDILLQGFSVLSVDTDIVLFKNPLDPGFNPWMNRELDIWTGIDNGRMLNCGFYFVRPTDPTDNFMRTWLGRFNAEASDDIWEQAEFNQILKGAHATMPELKWQALDEEWFPDLCFYLEARAVLPDQRQFGELFTSTSDKLDNWDKMFGFHAACCKGGGPALPECKRSITTALMHYQIKSNPSEWP